MKTQIKQLVSQALAEISKTESALIGLNLDIAIENTRNKEHGDYACNVALALARPLKANPRDVASRIIGCIPSNSYLKHIEVAGPGFINFFVSDHAKTEVIVDVLKLKDQFGCQQQSQPETIILEYVSANPTGPLHVGHGRGAAIGASLANVLKSQGYLVHQEYYVNDAGRQMDILASSVFVRYLQLLDYEIPFPSNGYKGQYVIDIAQKLHKTYQDQFAVNIDNLLASLPADEMAGGDKERYIDALIANTKKVLGNGHFEIIHQFGLNEILDDIRQDLAEFGVHFDNYFSEKSLFSTGDIDKGITALTERGFLYEKDGALWFKSTGFGDEKDRVLKRANGSSTYFASDVAYHWNKYDRHFSRVINIFGADHHGYVARVKAAAAALGFDERAIDVLLVQFAVLYRGKEKISMSTRSGEFVTLRELRQEVGRDATRFFYVMRKSNQHVDFDLELAKSQSNENPVYYVQYAHARIASVFRTLADKGLSFDEALGLTSLELLTSEHEQALMSQLQKYPELLAHAARDKEPHQVAYFLRELANQFHTYYNAHQFIVDDAACRNARLCLIKAVQQVMRNALTLIGVSAPEQM